MPLPDEFEPAQPFAETPPGSPWPQSSAEAKALFDRWEHTDPFPEVEPALLNSSHVEQYVRATGMVYPFYPQLLKSASYQIALGGDVVYWDRRERMRTIDLRKDARTSFTLRPNSIAYVTLEPVFRLPQYMALRFNLKIDNVYRGLLLGTGPLIDPGWCGRLSFPLHNLTTNDYEFKAGEEIIWVEFTKISRLPIWRMGAVPPPVPTGQYRPFMKRGGSVQKRLISAAPHLAIRSSLDEAYEKAENAAKLTNRIQVWGATALLVGLATIAGLAIDVGIKTNNPTTTTVTTVVQSPASAPAPAVPAADVLRLQRQIDALKRRVARIGG